MRVRVKGLQFRIWGLGFVPSAKKHMDGLGLRGFSRLHPFNFKLPIQRIVDAVVRIGRVTSNPKP